MTKDMKLSELADELERKMIARRACKTEDAADTFTHEIGLVVCGNPEMFLTALHDSTDRDAVLDRLAEHRNWELSYLYGDEESGAWQVHQVNGGANDREWTLIGEGETPALALHAALKSSPTNLGGSHD